MADENFGQRMSALRRERGVTNPGRPRIAEKYKPQIVAAERIFAGALASEAERYIEELAPQEPERCGVHGKILECPVRECVVISQRTEYDHKAAAYIFDRIMGKPTARTETTVSVKLVEELVSAFIAVFREVNELDSPTARQQAFAQRCLELRARIDGAAA